MTEVPNDLQQANGYEEITFGDGPPADPIWSICVPTYNRGDEIADSIRSAIEEIGERDAEILICDNASSDETVQRVRELNHPMVRLLRYHTTTSMYGNHNRCVKTARGKWVLFLHSDDTIPKDYLANVEEELRKHPSADLILNIVDADPQFDAIMALEDSDERKLKIVAAMLTGSLGPWASPSGAVHRKEVFEESGSYDDSHFIADVTLAIRWILDGHCFVRMCVKPPVWIVKSMSTSCSPHYVRDHWDESKYAFREALGGPEAETIQDEAVAIYRKLPAWRRTNTLYNTLAAGYRDLARRYFRADPNRIALLGQRRFLSHVVPSAINIRGYQAFRWRAFKMRQQLHRLLGKE